MVPFLIALSVASPPANPDVVIPRPSAVRRTYGRPTLIDKVHVRISGGSGVTSVLKVIERVMEQNQMSVDIVGDGSPTDIHFQLNSEVAGSEGYQIKANNGIQVTASQVAGLFYGAQSMAQIIHSAKSETGKVEVLAFDMQDQPRFPWRGMHLDVSRHFFTVSEVKDYIDQMARYKMNVFHWHLVDDGGWRMEVKKYPKLTRVGAWRTDSGAEIWNYNTLEFPGKEAGKKLYGGFYTQKQIKDVVKYAQERMVTIVPEIELPGHCLPAVVAYPEVSCSIEKAADRPYRSLAYCAGKEETFKFLEEVLDETMALFPSKTVHIGGDEVDQYYWSHCPDCQARMKTESLKNTGELQSYFVKRIEKYLNSKGRSLMGWDEILEGGLAPNAQVMSWRGIEGGIAAAKDGHQVVMTPTSHCYFDYAYDSISTDQVYNYDPIPAELTEEEGKLVLGAQGNVWTEWMPNYTKVQEMINPRIMAMAETLWTPTARKDLSDFKNRLGPVYARLVRDGIAFHTEGVSTDFGLFVSDSAAPISFIIPPIPSLEVRYTTNGTPATQNSTKYDGPFSVAGPATVRAQAFLAGKALNQPMEIQVRRPANSNPSDTTLRYKMIAKAFAKIPDFAKLDITEEGTAANISIDPWRTKLDTFAVEFRGYIKVPVSGVYRFNLSSDDGSALRIDGVMVVNHDGPHGATTKSGSALLAAGTYAFSLGYFEEGGAESLNATVTGPNGTVPLDNFIVH